MSRCFPFPPPGYEKKGRADDVDLLKKEKQREKKHKKEKRDKEKRESKERREKEGKEGKLKEKKDKKEKHRDRKKERDKEKDKNQNNTADEKGLPGQTESLNAGKLIQKEIKQNDRKYMLLEEKLPKHFANNNGEKAREKNNHLAEENKDSIFLQELLRRIKDDDGGARTPLGQELGGEIKEEDGRAGNQLVQKFTFASQKKDEGTAWLVAKDRGTWVEGKGKIKDKSNDVKKIYGQGLQAEAQPTETATIRNHAGNFLSRAGETPISSEKNFNGAVEATIQTIETSKEKKDDKPGDKRRDRGREKKGHGKHKDRDKEREKEEKVKKQTEHKDTGQNDFKVSNKRPLSTNSFPQITNNSHEIAVSGENLKKRKDMESNGIVHASDNWAYKFPRPSSSPHRFTENGGIVNPGQSSIPHDSDGPVAATNFKVNSKEHRKNGVIGVQTKPISASLPADPVIEEAETSAKPPHPDSKYLSHVCSVPKMDAQPDFDDQEWLFSSHSLPDKKPMALAESSKIVGAAQVWAEALHMEPDFYALPYVIPY